MTAQLDPQVEVSATSTLLSAFPGHPNPCPFADTHWDLDLDLTPRAADTQRAGCAAQYLLETEFDRVLDIQACRACLGGKRVLARTGETSTTAKTACSAEERPKEVGEAANIPPPETTDIHPRTGRPTSAPLRGALVRLPVRAQFVVAAALLGIGQDLVRLTDLLEASFGLGVTLVYIRVELSGEAPVGSLDLLRRGPFRDAQDGVIVFVVDGARLLETADLEADSNDMPDSRAYRVRPALAQKRNSTPARAAKPMLG